MRDKALEAEQALIGAAMIDGSWLVEADISSGDFLNEKNRTVWQSIEAIHANREPVDLMTVASHMAERGFKWTGYLSEVMRNTPSASHWRGYQEALKRHSRRVQAWEVLTEALAEITTDDGAVDRTISRLMALDSPSRNYDKDTRAMLAEAVESLEARHNGTVKALSTGVTLLDDFLGGLHDSDLIVVAARPAMGKTAVLLNMAMAANSAVGIISGEQGAAQVGERLFSIAGSVGVESMRRGKFDQTGWDAIAKVVTRLTSDGRIFINDHPSPDIGMIERQARKWKHTHGIRALFVDYIQRIKGGDAKAAKHERIGEIVRGLKSLARELDIPVVALAQVGRQVEARPDKRPNMGDISDSSEIEKEADQVITLYRDEVYNESTQDRGIIEFLVCKNRHGQTARVRAAWRGEFMQVKDIDGRY